MTTRQRYVRPPSVEDYARMTQNARLSAARLVAEQTRLIEERRARIDLITRPHMRAGDYTPEETRLAATVLARIYDARHRESGATKAARLAELNAAVIACQPTNRSRGKVA